MSGLTSIFAICFLFDNILQKCAKLKRCSLFDQVLRYRIQIPPVVIMHNLHCNARLVVINL